MLGCLQQALSDALAVCPVICKAGGAGECKCARSPSESPVLLVPAPQQPARLVLWGTGPCCRELAAVFQLGQGGQEGSAGGIKLLAPADVHTPPKALGSSAVCRGAELKPLCTSLCSEPAPPSRDEALQAPSLQWEGDHTPPEQNPRVHSQFPFISLLLGRRR